MTAEGAAARATLQRVCGLAEQGDADSLEAGAALLERESACLRRWAPELKAELARCRQLAGQAASFYARRLNSRADPGYTPEGQLTAGRDRARVIAEA